VLKTTSVLNLLFAAALVVLQSQLLVNLNPFASSPFCTFGSLPLVLSRLLMLLLTFFQASILKGSPTVYSFLVCVAFAITWLLGFLQPPSPNYSFNFQSSLLCVFSFYFSLSVYFSQLIDSGKLPDNLSLLYLLTCLCLISFIHYFTERHKLALYLNNKILRQAADCRWLPALYSLVVLLDRSDAAAHRIRLKVYLKSLDCSSLTESFRDNSIVDLLHKIILSSRLE